MRNTSPERLREIDALLDAALDQPPSERDTFLDHACRGDPELGEAVRRLLGAHHASHAFLEQPAAEIAEPLIELSALPQTPPTVIGPFRIVREIGHGGMGTVFLATRDDGQFEQRVALKVIRQRGAVDLVSRFLDERRILARLEHPHIARLVDGGVTSDGVPWFAMEYVEGEPIDRYCDAHDLSIEQRLELFAGVCDAVQYAHQHFVIHRDLKPSNILVGVDGQLKLLDFGVAKLVDAGSQPGDEHAIESAAQPLTPEYAAPEQVRGNPVSASTDVYALGVLLYVMLTGRQPYEVRELPPAEVERIICEVQPKPPSAVGPARLRATLWADLDSVVLKALSKEPAARYTSAQELVQDVRRYLSGHPVLARSQTVGYRARRFARRHRSETIAAAGVALSLIVGTVLALAQARHARAERDRAELASRQTDAVNAFLVQLFEASDPSQARGDTLTARELVQRAAERLDQFRGEPLEQARLLEVTGRLYQNLGQFEQARSILERALSIRRRAGNQNEDEGIEGAADFAQLSRILVRLSKFDAADSAARTALAIQQRRLGPRHATLAGTLHQLASVAVYRGDLALAEQFHRRAVAVRQTALGEEDSLTAYSHLLLGTTLRREGHFDEAEREFRRGIAISERVLGRDDPQVAFGELLLADLLNEDERRLAEAGPLYYRALEIRRRAYGEGHPIVAYATADLADFLSRQGNDSAAIPLARQYLSMLQRAFGSGHPVAVDGIGQVATILQRVNASTEAESLWRQSVEMNRKLWGPEDVRVAGSEGDLARMLMRRGAFTEARERLRDAVRIDEKVFGLEHPLTARMRGVNGLLLMHEKRYADADSALRRAVETIEKQLGRASPVTREVYGWLADLEDARSHHAAAERYRAIATAR